MINLIIKLYFFIFLGFQRIAIVIIRRLVQSNVKMIFFVNLIISDFIVINVNIFKIFLNSKLIHR